MNQYFVTGTDTDCGKTLVTSALLEQANLRGLSSIGLKPVAAGCELVNGKLMNEDACLLMASSSIKLEYSKVNPVALEPAIAPHIAASHLDVTLSARSLCKELKPGMEELADLTLVEGAGGWFVPLNDDEYLSDIATLLELPVILVVGMKLGCISHALLTQAAIEASGLAMAGWVANLVDPDMGSYKENLDTLHTLIKAPCLGEIPYLGEPVASDRIFAAAQLLSLPNAVYNDR